MLAGLVLEHDGKPANILRLDPGILVDRAHHLARIEWIRCLDAAHDGRALFRRSHNQRRPRGNRLRHGGNSRSLGFGLWCHCGLGQQPLRLPLHFFLQAIEYLRVDVRRSRRRR